jgi:TolB-like protein/cytochrome c-type biogenesis protein CcmH/NrfG
VKLDDLLAELKRRRVIRALVGYGIAAFAVLQIIEPVMHGLHWPEAVLSYVVAALAAGFPLVVTLAWIFDVNAGRIERTEGGPRGPRVAALLIGIGLVAAAPGIIYYFVLRSPRSTEPAAHVSASIAVLPLVNLSRDPDQEYFADGLAEELLNLLAKVPGLHVAARTSAFSFKGKNEDVRSIGEKLNVATVLEGSVRKAGDQVRITTQLINSADGYHLWSETYDRKLTDVFAVQDEIAKAVVAALRIKLLPAQEPTSKRTSNPEAYNQYLLGRQLYARSTTDGFRRAKDAYAKALALDPGFAPAWAGFANAAWWFADGADTAAAIAEGKRQALAAAEKAVALAPDMPDGYLARGFIREGDQWDWSGARADYERALSLGPEDVDVKRYYASFLRTVGRLPEAIAVFRETVKLDPLNSRGWTGLGAVYIASGQLALAREALNRSLEINPEQNFAAAWLGVALLVDGQPAVALASFERSTAEWFRLQGIAAAHHDLGHAKESQQALEALIAKHSDSAAYQIAGVYAWRGEKDRAFEWLGRAVSLRDSGLTLLKCDPMMRGLRGDPRYRALLAKLNLPLD